MFHLAVVALANFVLGACAARPEKTSLLREAIAEEEQALNIASAGTNDDDEILQALRLFEGSRENLGDKGIAQASMVPHNTLCNWANGTEQIGLTYGNAECLGESCQNYDFYPTSAAEGSATPVPLAIFVHGGGWRAGTKCDIPPQLLDMRQRGWHVASINYRLSRPPQGAPSPLYVSFPTHMLDVEKAIFYFKSHASVFNLDPERIVLVGSSAGGNLVSSTGTFRGPNSAHRVAGVVNFYGPTILYEEWDERIENMLNCTGHDVEGSACYNKAVTASPITHVSDQNPDFLTFFGINDPGFPAAQPFQDKGETAGANFTLYTVECGTPETPCHNRQTMLAATSETDAGEKCNTDIMYDWMADKVLWYPSCSSPSPCERRDECVV